nr:ring-h2 finger protein atl64 [Quercus suber]
MRVASLELSTATTFGTRTRGPECVFFLENWEVGDNGYRVESRPMFEIESRIDLEQPEPRTGGLEQGLVAAIPTMKFNREAFSSMEDPQCSICLAEYQEKDVLRIMPKCSHTFHLSCIDVWLRRQSTCPVCRLPLQDSIRPKPMRPLMFDITQPFDNSEVSMDHFEQWLLPGPHRSGGNVSNQAHVVSVPVNPPEPTVSGEEGRRQ